MITKKHSIVLTEALIQHKNIWSFEYIYGSATILPPQICSGGENVIYSKYV
jgi:hypothetical protein